MNGRRIDAVDMTILSNLQENARISHAELGRRVGLAPSAVLERVRRLERGGLVRGYEARLDPGALGCGLLAFVFVRVSEPTGQVRTGERLARIPEVLEVHHVAGEDCYLAKVRAADPQDLGRILRERFGSIAAVRSTRSTIVLGTIKETNRLPVTETAGAARPARTRRADGGRRGGHRG